MENGGTWGPVRLLLTQYNIRKINLTFLNRTSKSIEQSLSSTKPEKVEKVVKSYLENPAI